MSMLDPERLERDILEPCWRGINNYGSHHKASQHRIYLEEYEELANGLCLRKSVR